MPLTAKPPCACALLIIVILLAHPTSLWAYILDDPDPSPFRRVDEIAGRDYLYDRDTFLHRFTYRYHPRAARAWRTNREGFRTTVGSVKTNEAYVKMQAYKTVNFDVPAFFTYRFKRDEDFDSRYDSNLIGLGLRGPEHWTLTVLSDVVAAKENLNTHVEIQRHVDPGRSIRVGFVAADVTYNPKQEEEAYRKSPFTYFAHLLWEEDDAWSLQGYINYTTPVRLYVPIQAFDFAYEQLQGGMDFSRQLSETLEVFTSFKAEHGTRDRWSTTLLPENEQHFSRRYAEGTLQVTRTIDPRLDIWLGTRLLTLMERDRRPQNPEQERTERRREHMVYGGINWQFHEKALFWPGVYLNFADNRIDYPASARAAEDDTGCFSKLALPLQVSLSPAATLTFNLTLRLHRLVFGGMNFQAEFRF